MRSSRARSAPTRCGRRKPTSSASSSPRRTGATTSRALPRSAYTPSSLSCYLGIVFHVVGANTPDRSRLGVILEYAAGCQRPQENHILGVPKAIVRSLPVRLQELLG